MANYGRDTGEAYSTANSAARIGSVLAGFAALTAGLATGVKNSQKQDIQNQIAACDRRINDLKSSFLGSWLNSDQIEAEKKKRAELLDKYNNI